MTAVQSASVQAVVRYLNDEWRDREDIPRIGDRDSRRANTYKRTVAIHDARVPLASGAIDLDINGFALLKHASKVGDFHSDDEVKTVYYPEIIALAKVATGAAEVFITQHVVRTEDTSDFNKAYARFLHCDYSQNAPRDTARRALEKRGEDVAAYEGMEFAWYNSWQPFDHAVQKNPLAVVDAQSLADDDVVDYFYTGYSAREGAMAMDGGKSSMPMHNPGHRFYYVSSMATDELLFLKQLDTREALAASCPHTSFDDPTSPVGAPPRRSIEVRMLAAFD